MITFIAVGLGRVRMQDQANDYVLNFLSPKAFAYHLDTVMGMNAEQRADVYAAMTTHGKVSMEWVKVKKSRAS